MNAELKAAVDTLKSSYGDIDREAATYGNLNPTDIDVELQKAKPDTAEFVVLSILASKFPVVKNATKVIHDVVTPTSIIND
jgi:hypothetical protein